MDRFDFPSVLPWLTAILISVPATVQRLRYCRRQRAKIHLIFGAIVQLALIAILAHTGLPFFGRLLSTAFLFAYALASIFDYWFFRAAGQSPNADMLLVGLRERGDIWKVARGYVGSRDIAISCGVIVIVILPGLFPARIHEAWIPVGAIACLVVLTFLGRRGPPPGEALCALFHTILRLSEVNDRGGTASESRPRSRTPFPGRSSGGKQMNFVTIMNESLSRTLLYGAGADATQKINAFRKINSTRIFDFQFALSNSGASDVSYPSLFSGLAPTQKREQFENNPLIWSAAKAAGYNTAFFTAWKTQWAGLNELIVDRHVDLFVDPVSTSAPLVNDTGIDDRILTQHFIRYLELQNDPFFAVIAYNAQHIPCLVDTSETGYDLRTRLGRYLNSLTILDTCLQGIIETLQKSGRLEKTAIFFLSDHGEIPDYFDNPGIDSESHSPRVDDLCHEILSVPFWIYIPEGALDSLEKSALRNNEFQAVSNLDYYPTVLSLMRLQMEAEDRRLLNLGGHSLLEPLPVDRLIPGVNTGELRSWRTAPVSIASGHELLIYHDTSNSFELLNLKQSPKINLWPGTTAEQKALWMGRLESAGLGSDKLMR